MNTIKRLITITAALAAWAVFPLTLGAVTSHACACGKATAASYSWNFRQEADSIFKDFQADAQQFTSDAATLQSFTDDPNITWQVDVGQLNALKSDVNDMGQKLCRLETIRRVVAPWQQDAIDRIAANLPLMADNTRDAILFVNAHQLDLVNPTYQRYADNLYWEGHGLTRSATDAVEYAKVLGEYHELRGELGVGPRPS
ncbi:MAG: hypothetical protein WB918_02830 [Candidatus Sulfotelmatobacter sp.]